MRAAPSFRPAAPTPSALIWAALFALIGLAQPLLWAFLGFGGAFAIALEVAAILGLTAALARDPRFHDTPAPVRRIALIALAIGVVILLLAGGGGGYFYANTDWQVRGAVLRDLALQPWPFVYDISGGPLLLRAPLGMYLLPAAAGRVAGVGAANWALLAQNAAVLALLMTLAAQLFDTARASLIAALIFFGFSGLDVIGTLAAGLPMHLMAERWNVAVFSSHLDGIFATPQHVLAGWLGAVGYLLWRDRRLPLVAFLTPLPLLALWSPLALMGLVPFAAHAVAATLMARRLQVRDVLLPALATIVALPSLVYLAAGSGAVGGREATLSLHQYLSFETLEVGPYLLALALVGWRSRFGGVTLLLVAASLFVAPLIQVGSAGDFTMRAAIPALAILAIAVADALVGPHRATSGLWRGVLIVALSIGGATPAVALWRAVSYPPRPAILCSYVGVVPGGFATYTAPLGSIPPLVAPRHPARVRPADPAYCWSGPWPDPLRPQWPDRGTHYGNIDTKNSPAGRNG